MTTPRKVIIVSPHFPPSMVAGVHRARHLAKHLPAAGWTPIILCVHERFHEERLDPELAQLIAPSTRIVKVGAMPAAMARGCGFGDIGLRGFLPLRSALARLLPEASAVLITGFPFYPMLLAGMARRAGVAVVLDFQDPWVSEWGAAQPEWSKAGVAHRVAAALEPSALRNGDYVTSVSARQNEAMAARYPWLDAARMAALPIGGDPDDFAYLRRRATSAPRRDDSRIELSFVGSFMPRSGAPMRALLRAFAQLREAEPRLAQRLHLNFIGTSNQTSGDMAFRIRPLAEQEGVGAHVREEPRRLPYLSALEALVMADGVLLIGSDEPHYTASKIYPALMSGRPWLSLFHRDSSADAILRAAGGGVAVDFASADDLDRVVPVLVAGLRRLATEGPALGSARQTAFAPYEARAIAGRFAAIFDRLAEERGAPFSESRTTPQGALHA